MSNPVRPWPKQDPSREGSQCDGEQLEGNIDKGTRRTHVCAAVASSLSDTVSEETRYILL